MIDQLRIYVCGAVIVALLAAVGLSRWELHSVTKEFANYKESINEQVAAAKIEAARIAKIQDDKYQRARADYADSVRNLDSILNRLRSGQIVSRDSGMQMAGSSSGAVPAEAGYPTRIDTTVTARERACQGTQFYSDALRDTLQCQRLIELVR